MIGAISGLATVAIVSVTASPVLKVLLVRLVLLMVSSGARYLWFWCHWCSCFCCCCVAIGIGDAFAVAAVLLLLLALPLLLVLYCRLRDMLEQHGHLLLTSCFSDKSCSVAGWMLWLQSCWHSKSRRVILLHVVMNAGCDQRSLVKWHWCPWAGCEKWQVCEIVVQVCNAAGAVIVSSWGPCLWHEYQTTSGCQPGTGGAFLNNTAIDCYFS